MLIHITGQMNWDLKIELLSKSRNDPTYIESFKKMIYYYEKAIEKYHSSEAIISLGNYYHRIEPSFFQMMRYYMSVVDKLPTLVCIFLKDYYSSIEDDYEVKKMFFYQILSNHGIQYRTYTILLDSFEIFHKKIMINIFQMIPKLIPKDGFRSDFLNALVYLSCDF